MIGVDEYYEFINRNPTIKKITIKIIELLPDNNINVVDALTSLRELDLQCFTLAHDSAARIMKQSKSLEKIRFMRFEQHNNNKP